MATPYKTGRFSPWDFAPVSPPANATGNGLFAPMAPTGQRPTSSGRLSVADIMASNMRGRDMSLVTDARTKQRLSNTEAQSRMPRGGFQIDIRDSVGFGGRRSPIRGYSGQNQGTGADYIRQNGGLSAQRPSLLNELYRNQPGITLGAHDRLQLGQQLDRQDPIASFYADQMGVAQGQGNFDKAGYMQAMLQDSVAQRMAGSDPFAQTAARNNAVFGGGTQNAGAGTGAGAALTPWDFAKAASSAGANQAGFTSEIMAANSAMLQEQADRERMGTMWEPARDAQGEILGEGTLHTPYGTASVNQNRVIGGPSQATFDNPHGSSLGGVNFPGYQGRFTAEEMFQDTANRTGQENKYAVPAPGFGGRKSNAWSAYEAAMATKNKLKA